LQKREITSETPKLAHYLRQVWLFRGLLLNLTRRNLKVKYAQTYLGIVWVLLQPLTGMVIFTLFFSGIFDLSSFGIEVPYYLFAYSGYATWIYAVYVIQSAGTALVQDETLIKKSYFPKLILPLSRTLVGLVDYIISLAVLVVMAGFSGDLKLYWIWTLPLVILITTIVAWSVAFWLAALTIRFRDFVHLIPYLINFGIWLSPVFYPATIIPAHLSFLIYMNPMAAVVELTRWSILGTAFPGFHFIWVILACSGLLLAGLHYFVRVEDEIADYV